MMYKIAIACDSFKAYCLNYFCSLFSFHLELCDHLLASGTAWWVRAFATNVEGVVGSGVTSLLLVVLIGVSQVMHFTCLYLANTWHTVFMSRTPLILSTNHTHKRSLVQEIFEGGNNFKSYKTLLPFFHCKCPRKWEMIKGHTPRRNSSGFYNYTISEF